MWHSAWVLFLVWFSMDILTVDSYVFLQDIPFLSWTHPLSFFPVDINGPLWYISYDMMGAIFVMSTMSLLARVRKIFMPFILAVIGWILIALHFWFIQLPFPTLDRIVSVWFPCYIHCLFALHFLVGIVVSGLPCFTEKNHAHHSIRNDILFTLTTIGIFYFLLEITRGGWFWLFLVPRSARIHIFHHFHRIPPLLCSRNKIHGKMAR